MASKKKRRGPGRPRKPKPKPERLKLTRDMLYRFEILHDFFREARQDPDPNRRFLSYRGIAEKFGWGKNTVVRDIASMQLTYKAPLAFIKERGGWGYTENFTHLPNILISEGDLTVLCASWAALERRRDTSWGDRVRSVMERLLKALDQDLSFDFQTVSERIAFRSSGYQDAIDIQIFETVVSAVLSQHELRFVYRKTLENGMPAPPEERQVQPRCLVCVDNAWYIVADDPIRGGLSRTFALFRMLSAEDTGQDFTPNGPFNLDEILGDNGAERHSLRNEQPEGPRRRALATSAFMAAVRLPRWRSFSSLRWRATSANRSGTSRSVLAMQRMGVCGSRWRWR